MRKESTEQNTAPSLHPCDPLFVRLELIFFAVFAVFAAVMLVLPLHHPLELWDESSHANTALEMVMHGHWLTPTYNWKPDHWNTKPPLLIWIAAGLVRLGVRPLWAMRLPSGIAGLATVAAVYLFCRNVLRRLFVALVAALLLMGSTFFFGLHVSMSGDMDALLSLCTTLYVLAFFCFTEQTAPYTNKAIAVAGIALGCAVLTKGVAGIFMLPGLLLYTVLRGRTRRIASDPRLWAALAFVVITAALYYLCRERVDPGYLRAVWNAELGGRFGQPLEGHEGPWFVYLQFLFPPRSIALLFGLLALASLLPRPVADGTATQSALDGRWRAAAVCLCSVLAVFLLLLSVAKTKLWWYCAPAVPLLSIVSALGCANLLDWISAWTFACSLSTLRWLQVALLVLLTCHLYLAVRRNAKDTLRDEAGEQANYGAALDELRAVRKQTADTSPVFLIDVGYTNETGPNFDPVADFYAKAATWEGMQTVRANWPPAHAGKAWVLTCNPETAQVLQTYHVFTSFTRLPNGCIYGPSTP